MRPDGCLEHLGRKDLQVKIRGHRVETGAVEAVLHSLDIVQEAAVVARESPSGNRRLVCYVVPASMSVVSASELRTELARVLPDYMIPTAYVLMDGLPLTLTGKIDRRALPEPSTSRPELDQSFVAPQSAMEKRLSVIWSEALQISPVGIRDHFLELGGQSLLAARVVSRIRSAFGVELSLRQFLDAPTVAALTVAIERAQQAARDEAAAATAGCALDKALSLLERF
jgi:non-ribosomal peptide synthetase component F